MKKFTHKLLKLLLTAFFISSVMPAAKSNAEDICSGIGPNTVVRWDNDELRIGQIGRLMVIHDTPLFKLEGDKKTTVRMLKAGEKYRIYAFKPGKLSVGGGLYVDRNTMIKYETPSQVKLAQLSCKSKATAISKMSIQLDELKTTVEAKFGKEKRVSLNEYGDNWYTYHNGYRDYYMVSYLNGRAAAIFTMDDDYYLAGIHVGSSLADVKNALGTPIKGILKGNINYLITNNNELETFYKGGAYITVFYDIHNLGKVTGIQVVSAQEENKKAGRFGTQTPALQQAFEMQMFDLLNAARVQNGLHALQWSEKAKASARKHSQDMAVNNFFDHTNLRGQSPFDRMKAEGISYEIAGENIATGYSSSIFAHEALMNSLGHRENILNPHYTQVGVGVYFQSVTQFPYYTQNFYTPF